MVISPCLGDVGVIFPMKSYSLMFFKSAIEWSDVIENNFLKIYQKFKLNFSFLKSLISFSQTISNEPLVFNPTKMIIAILL